MAKAKNFSPDLLNGLIFSSQETETANRSASEGFDSNDKPEISNFEKLPKLDKIEEKRELEKLENLDNLEEPKEKNKAFQTDPNPTKDHSEPANYETQNRSVEIDFSDLIQCGTTVSKQNRFFIKKMAVQKGINVNTVVAKIFEKEMKLEQTWDPTDEDAMRMEDDYKMCRSTASKMTFIIPKQIKNHIDQTSLNIGIKMGIYFNYVFSKFRTENIDF